MSKAAKTAKRASRLLQAEAPACRRVGEEKQRWLRTLRMIHKKIVDIWKDMCIYNSIYIYVYDIYIYI